MRSSPDNLVAPNPSFVTNSPRSRRGILRFRWTPAGRDIREELAFALFAEQRGLHGFFRSDHVLSMGTGDGLPGPTESWVTLAGLARETSTVRLGTLVSSATFRHPSLLAIQVGQVDAMAYGRVELGLGTGWFAEEHRAHGVPFPKRRLGLLEGEGRFTPMNAANSL